MSNVETTCSGIIPRPIRKEAWDIVCLQDENKTLRAALSAKEEELFNLKSKRVYKADSDGNISLVCCENCNAKEEEVERLREAFSSLYYHADKLCKRAKDEVELKRRITDLTRPLYEFRGLQEEVDTANG